MLTKKQRENERFMGNKEYMEKGKIKNQTSNINQ